MTQFRMAWRAALAALGAAGLAAALGGCANDSRAVIDVQRTHKINVTSHFVQTPIEMTDSVLEPAESAKLAGAVADFIHSGSGSFDIVVPAGVDDAAAKAETLRRFAIGAGARADEVQARLSDVAGGAPIVVSYERYVATPPNCGPTTDNAAYNPRNLPQDSFGCVTQNNLAVMVSNPADLVRARRETPPDPTLRASGVRAYREGETPSSDDSAEPGPASSF